MNYYFFNKKHHLFHLVNPSAVPIALSLSIFLFVNVLVDSLYYSFDSVSSFFFVSLLLLILCINLWFYRLFKEYSLLSVMNATVERNYVVGMLLFVCSEVCLFAAVFWSFFNSSLSPSIFIGALWPPVGIASINPFKIPMLNTLLLLTSGATANNFYYLLRYTSVRYSFIHNNFYASFFDQWQTLYGSLFSTIILGSLFMSIQAFEYLHSLFTISDSIYGSCFFMATGLHGLHVFLGLTVLFFIFIRLLCGDYDVTQFHTLLTTCALIYWHFVDVVWLFLFIFVYIWAF